MEGGPPIFPRDFTCPAVLWILPALRPFRLRDFHTFLSAFPDCSAKNSEYFMQSKTPMEFLPLVWPLPRSLATTYGISVDFFSSPYLDVSVQAVPLHKLWIHLWMHELLHADCSIRTSADQCLLTAPRSFSQLTTSFFGSQCQGIHSALFFALPFVWFFSEFSRPTIVVFVTQHFGFHLHVVVSTYCSFLCILLSLFCFQASSLFSFKNRY